MEDMEASAEKLRAEADYAEEDRQKRHGCAEARDL